MREIETKINVLDESLSKMRDVLKEMSEIITTNMNSINIENENTDKDELKGNEMMTVKEFSDNFKFICSTKLYDLIIENEEMFVNHRKFRNRANYFNVLKIIELFETKKEFIGKRINLNYFKAKLSNQKLRNLVKLYQSSMQ